MLTLEIIKILADGKPRSITEVVELTGQSRQKVHNAFTSLLRHGMTTAEPVRYTATDLGVKRAQWRPQTLQEKREKQYRKLRGLRAAAKREKMRVAAREAREQERRLKEAAAVSVKNESVLEIARSGRIPNSVFALGGA